MFYLKRYGKTSVEIRKVVLVINTEFPLKAFFLWMVASRFLRSSSLHMYRACCPTSPWDGLQLLGKAPLYLHRIHSMMVDVTRSVLMLPPRVVFSLNRDLNLLLLVMALTSISYSSVGPVKPPISTRLLQHVCAGSPLGPWTHSCELPPQNSNCRS